MKTGLKYLFVISFVLSAGNVVSQQRDGKSLAKEDKPKQEVICPKLIEFIKDPAFISKVAAENGLSSIRFYSLETPTQKEMLIRYGVQHDICPA